MWIPNTVNCLLPTIYFHILTLAEVSDLMWVYFGMLLS